MTTRSIPIKWTRKADGSWIGKIKKHDPTTEHYNPKTGMVALDAMKTIVVYRTTKVVYTGRRVKLWKISFTTWGSKGTNEIDKEFKTVTEAKKYAKKLAF